MKRLVEVGLFLGVAATLLIFYTRFFPADIRHYSEAELAGLTCADLSEKNEEVITAYHDASITQYRQTGAFEEGLGVPTEDVLPLIIVMKKVIRDNKLKGLDPTKPFFHSTGAAPPRLHLDFYAETSTVCATHPEMGATDAILQAAENLQLTQGAASSQ